MIKIFYLTLILCLVSVGNYICAQDIIITKEGDIKEAYNVEVSSNAIFYKEGNDESLPILRIEKSKIFMIKHQDGGKTVFDDSTPIVNQTENQTVAVSSISKLAEQANTNLINDINYDLIYNNIDLNKSNKPKKAYILFCQFNVTPESQLINDDIEVKYTTGVWKNEYNNSKLSDKSTHRKFIANSLNRMESCVQISITNKTNRTIFIDLGNSFFTRNGSSAPFYLPKVTSSTTGGNSGVSVGLAGVTSALGFGGALGQIASGVTVGGGNNHAVTTTTYSQRVISIPPKSSKNLEEQLFFPKECFSLYPMISFNDYGKYNGYAAAINLGCDVGYVLDWDIRISPIKWGTFITYSFDENFGSSSSMKADFYLKKSIGMRDISIYMTTTRDAQGNILSTPIDITPEIKEKNRIISSSSMLFFIADTK